METGEDPKGGVNVRTLWALVRRLDWLEWSQ